MTDNTNTTEVEVNEEDQNAQVAEDQNQDENEVETQEVAVVEETEEVSVEEDEAQAASDDVSEESDDSDDDEEALVPLAKLKKVRNEAKNLRERLKTSEARVAELEANTGEDKINEVVASLTKDLRTERLQRLIGSTDSGAIEPNAVVKLLDYEALEWESNKPTNLDAVLEQTKKDFPRLFSSTRGSGNVGERNTTRQQLSGKSSNQLLSDAYADS